MRISGRGVQLIKQFEGLRLKAYVCPAGKVTIGYGHRTNSPVGTEITSHQADVILQSDLENFEAGVNQLAPSVTQPQFDALVCFSYNCGLGALAGSTLLKKLKAGDVAGAADEFLRWDKADGKSSAGLLRRRTAEKALFLDAT